MHVTVTPGATDAAPAGHDTADKLPVPVNAPSITAALLNVTFPVFFTANENVTPCPAADTVTGNTDFFTDNPGDALTPNTTDDGGEVTVRAAGSVPDAVAVLLTDPASISACVTV